MTQQMNDIQKQDDLRLMYIDYVVERLGGGDGAIIDLFAGGGGASEGIKAVFGRDPDVAVNHDPDAISMHQVNHKNTMHFTADVFEVDPLSIYPERQVGVLWASPACTHFSKARGSTPVCKQLRSLAWVVVKWAKLRRPRMIFLENVEEFADWCPINQDGYPIKAKKGETFKRFVASLETLGYDVEWKVLSADDYGAPTIRKRLFMVARCDGLPIVWAEPTHGDPSSKEFQSGALKPWRSAAEITNFLIPSHSIFMGTDEIKAQKLRIRRPLQETSLRRIGKGLEKYVLTCKHPFMVTKDKIQADGSIDSAWIVKYYNNASNPNQVMGSDIRSPLPTITTVDHNALATVSFTPFVSTYFGENRVKGKKVADGRGSKITDPLSTITSGGMRHALVTPLLIGIDNKSSKGCSWSPLAPLTTITTENRHAYVEASFLGIYYGNKDDIGQALTSPLRTITTKDRFCKVDIVFDKASHTYWGQESFKKIHAVREFLAQYTNIEDEAMRMGIVLINGQRYQMVDIKLRMFSARELFDAQSFPKSYIIDRGIDNKVFTKTKQVHMVGNSVPPKLAEAVIRANVEIIEEMSEAVVG